MRVSHQCEAEDEFCVRSCHAELCHHFWCETVQGRAADRGTHTHQHEENLHKLKTLNTHTQSYSVRMMECQTDFAVEEKMEIERLKMHKEILLEDIEKLKNQIENVMADIQGFKSAEDKEVHFSLQTDEERWKLQGISAVFVSDVFGLQPMRSHRSHQQRN
ncbi:cytohesin 4 [Triplophysa rosa]|uniref:Cytohesin 4 n=1 Tax=Triplophysa rosa TaxID=992332 RepID=A0A9W8C5Y4_TRIRA|nr:cytohesin 4 [Triplophysa rosa]